MKTLSSISLCVVLSLTSILSSSGRTNATEFFVSPSGSDDAVGTINQPFASIYRAQLAVREERINNPTQPVTVTLRSGRYSLDRPLVFTSEDSGAATDSVVMYRAERGGDVELSGGFAIRNWQPVDEQAGLWKTRVANPQTKLASDGLASDGLASDGAEEDWRFEQMWVNGRRATRARTPNHWEFFSLFGASEKPIEGEPNRFKHHFAVSPSDLATLEGLSQDELKDVQILAFHKWDTTREFIDTVDVTGGQFSTTGDIMKSWNPMTRDSLYFFENYRAALDAPGEWFLGSDGWLFYQARDGETMETADVVAAKTDRLIEVRGEIENVERRVKHLRFEGLQLRYCEFRIPSEGIRSSQAAMNVDATAVELNGCHDIQFIDCHVEHIGGTGFWFRKACNDCRVERTRVFDCGIAAVRIGEMQIVPVAVRTGGIAIDNCIFHSGGRITPHSVGVWIGHSSDNSLTHCDIADFYYTAVSVGWRWGYAESAAKRNKIEFNHLHHIGYRILSDMGGVYTLGPSEGTTVSNNVIHDVYSTRYGGWGLYPDEGSTGIVYENNLVYDVRDGCFHQHYGRENIVRNNILAFSEEGQIAVTRAEPHQSFLFERNIVVFDQGTLLGYSGWNNGVKVEMDSNLYWRLDGQPFDFAGKSFAEWQQSGRDQDSIIVDPLFVDVGKRDFRLKSDSPAAKIGFKEFDFSKAGVYGDEAWKQLAKSTKYPTPYVVPNATPLSFDDHFEDDSPVSLLSVATRSDEGRSSLIKIVALPDGDGHCLRVQDADDLKASFNPHFHFDPHFVDGNALLSYRIRLEPGADVRCEWRSKTTPYRTGPSLHFANSSVETRGRGKLANVPVNEWVTVTMQSPLGQSNATWTATFTFADGTVQTFAELPCEPDWTAARWIGFSSQSADGVSFYLDDFGIRHSE